VWVSMCCCFRYATSPFNACTSTTRLAFLAVRVSISSRNSAAHSAVMHVAWMSRRAGGTGGAAPWSASGNPTLIPEACAWMPGRFVVPGITVCPTSSLMPVTPCCSECFEAAPWLATTSCLRLDFTTSKIDDTPVMNVARGLLELVALEPPWAGRLRRKIAPIMVTDGVRADVPVDDKCSRCDGLSSTSGVVVN
jgi:hypothetical protein